MGRHLAPELAPVLGLTGTDWPVTDETGLVALAYTWQKIAVRSRTTATEVQGQIDRIVDMRGDRLDGIRERWYRPGSPRTVMLLLPEAAEGICDRLIDWAELILQLKAGIEGIVSMLASELLRLAHHDPRLDQPAFRDAAEEAIELARDAILKMHEVTEKSIAKVRPPGPPAPPAPIAV